MDRCCALIVKNGAGAPILLRNSIPARSISLNFCYSNDSAARVFDIRFPNRRARASSCYGSFAVRANRDDSSHGSGNGDESLPEGDDTKGNQPTDSNKSNDTQKSHRTNLDWREFRANLFAREQKEKADPEARDQGGKPRDSKSLGLKWAHPIPIPEPGCVLVATEKLDGVHTFERTVVLLLRSGTRHPQEGPFGIVINRPLRKKIKDMNPTNPHLATTFSDCSLHFGGPLESSMFLLRSGENEKNSKLPGFEEVIPGLCYGARNSLHDAAEMVSNGLLEPQDFRFFVGYSGWQKDQLREEIESGYWHVAACSSDLVYGFASPESSSSPEGLWEEVLQLMGGQYSELSRKPKQDM